VRQARQVASANDHVAFRRAFLQQEQAEQGALAGAARAGQEHEIAFVDREREVAQGVKPAAVHLAEAMRLDH
jgi:hypothetical protein